MEIAIIGEGEAVIRFIDKNGETLLQEKLVVSGSPTVEGRRIIDLSVQTVRGPVPLAPVLVRQSQASQRITFDGDSPSRFTQKRCQAIGCSPKITRQAARGHAAPPVREGPAARLTDDQALAKMIKTKMRGQKR